MGKIERIISGIMVPLVTVLAALATAGCIKNDIPYPKIAAGITAMDVEGALSVSINSDARTVEIVLDEQTDMRSVNIRSVEFNEKTVEPSWDITGTRDLTSPLKLTLKTFDEYIWEIRASQSIERYFTVSGQVGDTWIDDVNHRAITQVSSSVDRERLEVTSLKLGPKDISTYSPDPSSLHDFTNGQEIAVKYHDLTQIWHLYVEQTETVVQFTGVDAWTKVVWLKASGIAGRENGFRYRKRGTLAWTEAPEVTEDGGSFKAAVNGLDPLTDYECIAYSGADETEIREFRTEAEVQVPNSGFETFSNWESDKFCSFFDPASPDPALQTKWWGSGNKGSTTVGSSYAITVPEAGDSHEGRYSVKLASAYVVIKFAAGNIFSGEYYKTVGTSGGIIHLGRPFTQRPQKVTVWLKYKSGIIPEKCFNGKPDGDPAKVGDHDRGVVWVALGDWDYHKYGGDEQSPLEVNTLEKSSFFDPKGPNVIAYGSFTSAEDISEWTKVEIPLEYSSTSRRPTHIVISAAASMLGDYFTGSPDSVMWLDDVRLEY